MFTDHNCPVCTRQLLEERKGSYVVEAATGHVPQVLLKRSPVATATCAQGHKTKLIVQDGHYALLFERALHRLAIGSTRDAVIDAHTAVEMYWVHAAARARYDREPGASPLKILESLKPATTTSDRAHGAALSAIYTVSGKMPKTVHSGTSKLRNEAAHEGFYPAEGATENMILDIERFVIECEALLSSQPCVNRASYGQAFHDEDVLRNLTVDEEPLPGVLVAMGTALDMSHLGERLPSAKRRIADYRERVSEGIFLGLVM